MKELIFVGRSQDNLELIFMDEDGGEFTVAVDEHIKRSINTNDTASVTTTDSTSGISPKDIQTRIRRGETAQAIATESGVEVARIERYAGPVLAERAYMANRAATTLIRRPHGEVVLGELATGQLANRGIDTLTLVWDSYRRDDSRWTVSVSWTSGSGGGSASWIYDPLARSVVALDDEARWLFDEAAGQDQSAKQAGKLAEEAKPRLVGLPTVAAPEEELEPPAWAGPGHPTMPVPMPVPNAVQPVAAVDDSPSWDDILFGHRPNDQ